MLTVLKLSVEVYYMFFLLWVHDMYEYSPIIDCKISLKQMNIAIFWAPFSKPKIYF